jgi:hypothetical protein
MEKKFRSQILTLSAEFFHLYETFSVAEISGSRFGQKEMLEWLSPLETGTFLKKRPYGNSAGGREISLYTAGSGALGVMLWSQMHGDEPTATMAIADILNFFSRYGDHPASAAMLKELNMIFIPMLNPDGAEHFSRCNSQLIDINRDALALISPEARTLKSAHNEYRPSFGFNLHDQDPRLTVGSTGKITAIALLAPPADEINTDTPERIRAKKVVSVLASVLGQFIPGHLARWDDTFESRAFGDSFQKWGTSTVLMESGGWRGDPDKFFLRKLNCVGLLTALYAIASGIYENADTATADSLPFNTKFGYDVIIRNVQIDSGGRAPQAYADIGINYSDHTGTDAVRRKKLATVIELGDLKKYAALEKEIDAGGARMDISRIQPDHPFPAEEIDLLIKRD